MKIIIYAFIFLVSFTVYAQKKQKIKGNREVIETYRKLIPFNQMEIDDDLEVNLMQSGSYDYSLNSDSNLVDVVKLEVVDSVLKIFTTKKIVSNKNLIINLTFQNLKKITLRNKTKLNGQNNFKLDSLELACFDNSNFELDINGTALDIKMNDNSKGKLTLNLDHSTMVLNDNAYINGVISIDELMLTVNKRADMYLEGNTENLNLITTGSSDIKAKKLIVTNAQLNASNTSDIYLYISKYLSIYAKGRSYIYVYGNPEIKIDGLNDKSQIIKR